LLGDFAKFILHPKFLTLSVHFSPLCLVEWDRTTILGRFEASLGIALHALSKVNPEGTDVGEINLQSSNTSLF
jgi:hypothetical protein